jgi:AraC-like DNA-binding protein
MKKKSLKILLILFTLIFIASAQQKNPYMQFVGKPYGSYHYALRDSLRKLYDHPDSLLAAIDKLRQLPDKLHDKQWQLEADFLEVKYSFDRLHCITSEELLSRMKELLKISEKANNKIFNIRIVRRILDFSNEYNMMVYAHKMEALLKNVTIEEYPDVIDCKLHLGELYFKYKDFPRAEQCFKDVVAVPINDKNQRIFILARNDLGLIERTYYQNYKESDKWFQSILDIKEKYGIRQLENQWVAIAKGNMGDNLVTLRQYDKAIPLLQESFETMYREGDYGYSQDMANNLADCYCNLGDFAKAKYYLTMSDSCLSKLKKKELSDRDGQFKILSKYYIGINKLDQANLCMDSALMARDDHDIHFNAGRMLNVEKEMDEYDLQQTKNENQINYNRFFFSCLISVGTLILLIGVLLMHIKLRKGYRALVIKNQQWAADNKPFESWNREITSDADKTQEEQNILLKKICDHLENTQCFTDVGLSLDSLAKDLCINRTYVSNAINETSEGFNAFVNKYRIRKAIQILSSNDEINMETLAESSGFNNRHTFAKAFKVITGLSPTQFKDNMSNAGMLRSSKNSVAILLLALFMIPLVASADDNPFSQFVGKPYGSYHFALRDSLRKRYDSNNPVFAASTVKRLRELPDKLHDKQWQLEADFFEANFAHDHMRTTPDSIFEQQLQKMLDISRKAKNRIFEIRITRRILDFKTQRDIINGIAYTHQLENAMKGVSAKDYPDIMDCKLHLGELYLAYKDYIRAEQCFITVATAPVNENNQRIFILARNDMGLIQRDFYHNYDLSDKWFRSIIAFKNKYGIKQLENQWMAIVKGYLGKNQALRRKYDKALPLMEESFETMYREGDYTFSYEMANSIANALCNTKKYEKAKHYIDMADSCFARKQDLILTNRQNEFISMSKYCAWENKRDLAYLYLDSAFISRNQYELHYSIGQMLSIEKQMDQYELQQKENESQLNYNRFVYTSIIFAGLVFFLIIFLILSTQIRKSYRALVIKNQQWATENKPHQIWTGAIAPDSVSNQDDNKGILQKICDYLEQTQCFTNPELALEPFCKAIGINRTYVSNAINATGDSFNTFINKYRVRKAIQMLSSKEDTSLEELSQTVGFNSRRTMTAVFKNITGLSPSQFKRNMTSNENGDKNPSRIILQDVQNILSLPKRTDKQ